MSALGFTVHARSRSCPAPGPGRRPSSLVPAVPALPLSLPACRSVRLERDECSSPPAGPPATYLWPCAWRTRTHQGCGTLTASHAAAGRWPTAPSPADVVRQRLSGNPADHHRTRTGWRATLQHPPQHRDALPATDDVAQRLTPSGPSVHRDRQGPEGASAGEVVGCARYSGNAESTSPHLHLSCRPDGTAENASLVAARAARPQVHRRRTHRRLRRSASLDGVDGGAGNRRRRRLGPRRPPRRPGQGLGLRGRQTRSPPPPSSVDRFDVDAARSSRREHGSTSDVPAAPGTTVCVVAHSLGGARSRIGWASHPDPAGAPGARTPLASLTVSAATPIPAPVPVGVGAHRPADGVRVRSNRSS